MFRLGIGFFQCKLGLDKAKRGRRHAHADRDGGWPALQILIGLHGISHFLKAGTIELSVKA